MTPWALLGSMLALNLFNADRATRLLRLGCPWERALAGFMMFWSVWIPLVYAAGVFRAITTTTLLGMQVVTAIVLWWATRNSSRCDGLMDAAVRISCCCWQVLRDPGSLLDDANPQVDSSWNRIAAVWLSRLGLIAIPGLILSWASWCAWRCVTLPMSDFDSTSIYGVQLALMLQTKGIMYWPWGHSAVTFRPVNSSIMAALFCLPFHSLKPAALFKFLAVGPMVVALCLLFRKTGLNRAVSLCLALAPFACHSYVAQFDLGLLTDDLIALLCALAVLWTVRALECEDSQRTRYLVLLAVAAGMLIGLRVRSIVFLAALHIAGFVAIAWLPQQRRFAVLRWRVLSRYLLAATAAVILLGGAHRHLKLKATVAYQQGKPAGGGSVTHPSNINAGMVDGKRLIQKRNLQFVEAASFHLKHFLTAPFSWNGYHYFFSTHLGVLGAIVVASCPLLLGWTVTNCSKTTRQRGRSGLQVLLVVGAGSAVLYAAVCACYHRWLNPDGRYYLISFFLMLMVAAAWLQHHRRLAISAAALCVLCAVTCLGLHPTGSFVAPTSWVKHYRSLPKDQQGFASFNVLLNNTYDDLQAFYLVETKARPGAWIARYSGKTNDVHLFGEDLSRKVRFVYNAGMLERFRKRSPVDYVMIHHPFEPMSYYYVEARHKTIKPAQRLLRYCLDHPDVYKLVYPDPKNLANVERREIIFKVVDSENHPVRLAGRAKTMR